MTTTHAAAVRWGVLATGRIADLVVACSRESPLVRFEAVGSRSLDAADAFARRHGIARAHGSYEELLEDPAIDAVYIGLPNAMHVPWTIAALEHGKHVLCEKPFSSHPDQVALAHEAARERGLLLAEAFMYRFHPQTAAVRRLVAEGRIGRLALIRAKHSFVMEGAETDFRSSVEMEGGALMDLGSYCVSAARMLAGEPTDVDGMAVRMPSGADIRFAAALRFPDDVIAQFDCAMDLPRGDDGLELVGSEGRIVVDDPWHCKAGRFTLIRGDDVEEVSVPTTDRYLVQLEAVTRAVAGEAELEFGGADAVAQATVLDRLLAASGQRPARAPAVEPS